MCAFITTHSGSLTHSSCGPQIEGAKFNEHYKKCLNASVDVPTGANISQMSGTYRSVQGLFKGMQLVWIPPPAVCAESVGKTSDLVHYRDGTTPWELCPNYLEITA